jgi:hypothetical protein
MDRPKFLKTTRERFGSKRLIEDIVYIYGPDTQAKGGLAKAKNAEAKYQQIRTEFAKRMQEPGAERHEVVGKLAKEHKRSSDRINRILRKK